MTTDLEPSWSDPDAAVAFLQKLRPRGPWNLTAIIPDVLGAESAVFTDPAKAHRWLSKRLGRANCYFMPNPAPTPTGANGRANKGDVRQTAFRHADIDLDKLPASHPWYPLDLAGRKAKAVEMLQAFTSPGPPTFIIDSGGGLQPLWRLDHPVKVSAQHLDELQNERLIELLGGDSGTWNLDRLLRLPGTPNLPDAKKRARGRVPAPAVLVESNPRSYADFEFDAAQRRPEADEVDIDIGPPEYTKDLAALATKFNLPDRIVTIINDGRLPESKEKDDSRSAWVFDCVVGLVRAGVPDEVIAGLLLDSTYDISESILEKGDDADERAAHRAIRNAHKVARDDAAEDFASEVKKPVITFTPYVAMNPATIEPRAWLYEPIYIRKFCTGTLAHGAVGKTSLLVVEAVAMAAGLPLLGVEPVERLRVAMWNGEDPLEEMQRKVEAARKHYGLDPGAINGWLFVDSGRNLPIEIAVQDHTGTKIAVPVVDALVEALLAAHIDVLDIDPFVAIHSVNENDNGAIEKVARAWNEVAERANCAVHLAHHAVKARGRDSEGMDFRGGGAALAKLRYLRVLNPLNAAEAEKRGVPKASAPLHFRAASGKANLTPPGAGDTWFKMESVDLGNRNIQRDGLKAKSDVMGVATSWALPDEVDVSTLDPTTEEVAEVFRLMGTEPWRKTSVSKDRWVGVPIAEALGLDVADEDHRAQLRTLITEWATRGVLLVAKPDDSDSNGNKREGYVPGSLSAAVV